MVTGKNQEGKAVSTKWACGPLPSARHTGVLYRPSGTLLHVISWDAVSLCACRLLSFVMR